MVEKIGVLALQGAFAKHRAALHAIGVEGREVRTASELIECDGLIIPGGESTTIARQLAFADLFDPIVKFAKKKPLFGTCAGLILMATELVGSKPAPSLLSLIDMAVHRNGYGRQADSFAASVNLDLHKKPNSFRALFIRAPRIARVGDQVRVLGTYQEEPVLVEQGSHLAAAFHPELGDNLAIHRYFARKVQECKVTKMESKP